MNKHYPEGHNVGLGMVRDTPEEKEISRLTRELAEANAAISLLHRSNAEALDQLVALRAARPEEKAHPVAYVIAAENADFGDMRIKFIRTTEPILLPEDTPLYAAAAEVGALTRAAELLEQWAEQMRDPCSNPEDGDFSCEDCPVGRSVCVSEHAEIVEAASKLRAFPSPQKAQ